MLQWVGAGCPAGIWESNSYKTTCQALQNRGLAKVSRRAGQWSVVLTSAGQHYLTHGTYPFGELHTRKTQAGPQPPPQEPTRFLPLRESHAPPHRFV